MPFSSLCLCPLSLTAKPNFKISKTVSLLDIKKIGNVCKELSNFKVKIEVAFNRPSFNLNTSLII